MQVGQQALDQACQEIDEAFGAKGRSFAQEGMPPILLFRFWCYSVRSR
jgi:hypothetical protein